MTAIQPKSDISGRPVSPGPAEPAVPGAAANYITGIADGNLTTPVKLRDFLFGVGVVYRLPKKAKPAKDVGKPKSRFALRIRLRVKPIAMALSPVAVAITGLLLYRQLSSAPMPAQVVGTWSTVDGRYKGRNFWLKPDAVAFQNGPAPSQFSVHAIKRVKIAQNADTLIVTIDYENDGKPVTLSLAYRDLPGPELRLVNQPKIQWLRTGAPPVIH
jgi:hypothetical protein